MKNSFIELLVKKNFWRGSARKASPRGWRSAQRINNLMIAGGNHTLIPSCHGAAKGGAMTDEVCGRQLFLFSTPANPSPRLGWKPFPTLAFSSDLR
jgi:hypothetical protein